MIALHEIREFAARRHAERPPLEVPAWGLVMGEVDGARVDRAIRFRRLDADRYYALRERAKAEQVDPSEGDASPRAIGFFVEMVATCAMDAEGNAIFDSDEGRALLRDADVTPFPLLQKVVEEAIEANGLGEKKAG